jgi:hypothetical protein
MNATATTIIAADIKLEKGNPDDLKERKIDLDKAIIGNDYDRVIKILRYF